MNIDNLFNELLGGYHDGVLCDAVYENGTLFIQCFRNPPDPDNKEDPNYRYVIIRFDNVTDLQVYNWDSRDFISYSNGDFNKDEDSEVIMGIDYLDYEDGFIVFGQCIRFRADEVKLLAHSSEEVDFLEYIRNIKIN